MSVNGQRWDQMTPKQRCFLLFKKLDVNTRAVAKLASAISYLGDEGLEVTSEAPDLFLAIRTVMRERRNLKQALESELRAMWRQAKAAAAAKVS